MKSLIFSTILTCLFFSCTENPSSISSGQISPQLVSNINQSASGPFFTADHNNKQVLVWTEKLPGEEAAGHVVQFARLNENGTGFDAPQQVTASKGCRAHDESMNKIAFKKDGTIVAVFSKRNPTKENRFAGALYYTQSFDGGKKWTAPDFLHVGNTTPGLSRSFFDLEALPDGEIGAIWLDSRLTKERGEGSSLFFSKTKGQSGFITDQVIATKTCECCRTDLFVSDDDNLHVTYRDILQDSIRDISHLVSTDNGLNFSPPNRISQDNWVINGCPHTGPSVGETKNELHYTWFTMGGGQGLYYTSSKDNGKTFESRKLLSEYGKHPQVITTPDDNIIFVWEELDKKIATPQKHSAHHNSNQPKNAAANSDNITSYIKAQVWHKGNPILEQWVSLPNQFAEYPVATYLQQRNVGIAWVQEFDEGKFGVYYKKIKI